MESTVQELYNQIFILRDQAMSESFDSVLFKDFFLLA